MTPSENEPANFQLVAQCLNQPHHPIPPESNRTICKLCTKTNSIKKTNLTFILFEVYLMLPVLQIVWHCTVGCLINELRRIWTDVVMTQLGYYSSICLEGMRKITKTLN